jgi:cytochrome c oxidase subunit 4
MHTHHVTSWQVLTGILVILLILTGFTVYTAREIHLPGELNLVLALTIAVVKASLVCAFFMHLLHDKAFNSVILLYCVMAIACFLIFTTIDLGNRGVFDPVKDGLINNPTIVHDAHEAGIQTGEGDDHAEDAGDEGADDHAPDPEAH